MFNRRKIKELEEQIEYLKDTGRKSVEQMGATIKRLQEELSRLTRKKKQFEITEGEKIYFLLRENNIEIVALIEDYHFSGIKGFNIAVKPTLDCKDLRRIICEAGYEIIKFSVDNGLFCIEIQSLLREIE